MKRMANDENDSNLGSWRVSGSMECKPSRNVLHTWMMKRVIGSFGLYFDGFAPSITPPCGGALLDGVGFALIVTFAAVDMVLR